MRTRDLENTRRSGLATSVRTDRPESQNVLVSAAERQIPASLESVDAVLGVGVFARPAAGPESEDRLLTTGVFARRSRLSMKALRLYDRQGLLAPAHVDAGSRYRRYRESQLATARLIVMLRRLDMPLAQVSEIVSAAGPRRAELLASYWEAVERRIAFQRELAAHLRIRLTGGDRTFGMFEVREREVPEQLVVAERRHVTPEELPRWIAAATARLVQAARTCGEVAGHAFVIYHGEVNLDSDGPLEVCVPVDLDRPATPDETVRREPAHREAYVRLRKAQVQYPQILSAYDAVTRWMTSRGVSGAGSPREVYFTDFPSAGPADEVCDVAFPLDRAG
jgi:DNA-binding transcriptional MerR regulator